MPQRTPFHLLIGIADGPKRMKPNDFGDPLTLHRVPHNKVQVSALSEMSQHLLNG